MRGIKIGVINAFIYYYTEWDDIHLHERMRKHFENIDISIKVPQNVEFNEISPDSHEGKIITFPCEVLSKDSVESETREASYYCSVCNDSFETMGSHDWVICPECRGKAVYDYAIRTESIQRLTVRELLEDSSAMIQGTREIQLHGSYAGKLDMGQRMMITGMLKSIRMKKKQGYQHATNLVLIDVIHAEPLGDIKLKMPTEEDINYFMRLAQNGELLPLLVKSFAYYVKGHNNKRLSLLLALVGGTKTDTHRGTIHVFFVGNPSTAKSKTAKFVLRVSQKSMYAVGNTTSKAGIGIGADRVSEGGRLVPVPGPIPLCSGDPKTGENEGHLVIDEFGLMNTEDMDGLRESMEDQTFTKRVTNVNMTVPAITSIIACANPQYGSWDDRFGIKENINIPSPVLSRFDLKWKFEDTSDEKDIEDIASHRFKTMKNTPNDCLSEDMLIRFLNFVRNRKPQFTPEMEIRITKYFSSLKSKENKKSDEETDKKKDRILIDWRDFDALIRLSTAFAKILMKSVVDEDCVGRAIKIYEESLDSFGMTPETNEFVQSELELTKDKKEKKDFMTIFEELASKDVDGHVLESDLLEELKNQKISGFKNDSNASTSLENMIKKIPLKRTGRDNDLLVK